MRKTKGKVKRSANEAKLPPPVDISRGAGCFATPDRLPQREISELERSAQRVDGLNNLVNSARGRVEYLTAQIADARGELATAMLNHQAECHKMRELSLLTVPTI